MTEIPLAAASAPTAAESARDLVEQLKQLQEGRAPPVAAGFAHPLQAHVKDDSVVGLH